MARVARENEMAQAMNDATVVGGSVAAPLPSGEAEGFRMAFGLKVLLSLVAAGIVYLLVGLGLASMVSR